MTQLNLSSYSPHILLPPAAHRWAQLFASKQIDEAIGKQVYHNTLSVFAVDEYLQNLGIATNLEDSSSWYPGLTSPPNSAELKIVGLGEIECRPVLAGESHVALPLPGYEIAYIVVQLSAALDIASLSGYAFTNQVDLIELVNLQPISDFTNFLGKLRDGFDLLESIDLEESDPLMAEFLAEASAREKLALLARSLPVKNSTDRERSKILKFQEVLGANLVGAGMRKSENPMEQDRQILEHEEKIRNLATSWLALLDRILLA